jgi:hypothetical protein
MIPRQGGGRWRPDECHAKLFKLQAMKWQNFGEFVQDCSSSIQKIGNNLKNVQREVGRMKNSVLVAAAFLMMSLGFTAHGWSASLVAKVDLSSQTMTVTRSGRVIYKWKVSTARKGYVTPRGSWRPTRLHRMWYSRKYDMSPMPYSVFYHRGYAIHGTGSVKQLGRPASHGCVRLHTANAAKFYALVKKVGRSNTRIVVVN